MRDINFNLKWKSENLFTDTDDVTARLLWSFIESKLEQLLINNRCVNGNIIISKILNNAWIQS